ncbi:MAG: 2Fe-2S iron-sulfur cluster-binding protein [Proteobacteria bacterium]|nr:2Fe-2S iron-sulfur cluster-binding protein [Pseudomonadota bacterium]
MPRITFLPAQTSVEVDTNTKLLLAGRKAGVDLRFGCASCRCGTCGVLVVNGADKLSSMKQDELILLKKLKLPTDSTIRMACQARAMGDCTIDLDFQNQYTPDDYNLFDEDS